MNAYVKYFNDSKCLNLLFHDREFLKKYNRIWNKISNLSKKGFDSEPMCNDQYIKIKIKIYNNRINSNFQGNKITEDNEYFNCLSVILLDSVLKINNYYYTLEESKYAVKKKKITNTIDEELDLDTSDDESDKDKSNESDEDYNCFLNGF